jgi:hypothetical protein
MKIFNLFFALALFFIAPLTAFAKDNQDVIGALNEKLQKDLAHYKNHSVQVVDSLTTSAKVTEEDVEETRKIQVVFAHARKVEVRDSIFYFDLKQIYYYDLDNNKLIDSGLIEKNEQIEKFINKYKNQVGKQLNALSLTIFMVTLFLSVIVIPVLAALFHNNSRSSSYKLQLEHASRWNV